MDERQCVNHAEFVHLQFVSRRWFEEVKRDSTYGAVSNVRLPVAQIGSMLQPWHKSRIHKLFVIV